MSRWLLVFVMYPTLAYAQPLDCIQMDDATKTKVRAIVLEGLDEALKDRVKHLFEVWMKDEGLPAHKRASYGTRLAVRAYLRARMSALGSDWACE